jgi:predicted nucleic acid-binding protein
VRRGRIDEDHAATFLRALAQLPIVLIDPSAYDDVFQLARRLALTVYDASYVEVALREDLPLATLDSRMREAAAGAGVTLFGK